MLRASPRSLLLALITLTSCDSLRRHSLANKAEGEASQDDRVLANETAFALTPSARGATLLWAPRTRRGAALFAQRLGADGTAQGAPTALVKPGEAPGEISDLVATSQANELVAAWVQRDRDRARVRGVSWRPDAAGKPKAAESTGTLLNLGPAWFAPHPVRGNLAVATQGAAAIVFARGEATPCVEDASDHCFTFSMQKIEQGRVDPRGFPLIVPSPCAESSLAFTVTGRDWHYGVCTRSSGKPLTTLFTIRAEPEYARADPILPGCRPLSVVELGGTVRLIADCDGQRRAAHVGPDNTAVEIEDLPSPALECQAERARIRFGQAWFELDAPRSELHALLPSVIAPRGSRAIFTGSTLLVARAKGEKLELSRYACRAGILRQLP